MKRKKKKTFLLNNTKNVVGSGMVLGVGGSILGSFEGMAGVPANLSSKTIGTGARMMGAVVPAAYGMETLSFINKKSKKFK